MILFRNPLLALGAPTLIIALHLLWLQLDAYNSLPHLDSLMHYAGGAACGLSLGWLLLLGERYNWWQVGSLLLSRLLLVGGVAVITIGWEVFELLVQPAWQPSIADTVKDQVLGVLGGSSVAMVFTTLRS